MGYEIVAIDEAGFHLTTTYKKIWFPRGETPRGAFFWSSKKLITFGALTSYHEFYYDFYIAQNSRTFRHFLRELFNKLDKKKKYLLILDNAGFHKTQCVKNLLAEYAPRIRVEYIPPYSPELNPVERVWRITRRQVTHNRYFQSVEELKTDRKSVV